METLILEESPLAAYLEGKGEAEPLSEELSDTHAPTQPTSREPSQSFAPSFRTSIRNRSSSILHKKPIARIRNAYAYAVASTLGSADNDRFLEHFRYILIASQLLNDHVAPGTLKENDSRAPAPDEYGPAAVSLVGAAISAAVAFALVWIIHWARGDGEAFDRSRLMLALGAFVLASLLIYGYVRRQWLQHLRHQALSTSSDFVTNAQAFEGTSTATLTMIQEVELVSRGYRISTPLPPISRLETTGSARCCTRLRRNLLSAYTTIIPTFADATRALRPYASQDDLERFLDVYDIREDDLEDALLSSTSIEGDEAETLKQLRDHQSHLSTFRRLLICTLLSIPATGRKEDAVRWRTVVRWLEQLGLTLGQTGQTIAKLLQDEENCSGPPSPIHQKATPPSPKTQAAFRSQQRHISELSSGIRSIQARLYLFRDDSTRALSKLASEPELLTMSTSLKDQYDAIGSDLRTLMHAWESGRQDLVEDITRHERRMSRASSALRSSTPSMGGLTAVEEDESESGMSPRSTAFQRLTGDRPITPPVTESEDEGSKDDEVFEAVARPPPRPRSTLTREERIKKMHEDRERQATLREKGDANANMIRELQTVINLRPSKSQRRNTFGGVPG